MDMGLKVTVKCLGRWIFVLSGLLAAGLTARAASNSADVPHVHVQLLSPWPVDHSSPGEVGLYFKLEPGWHVYWKNAGDSGEPPHIHWTLPNGFNAGPLKFPAPKRLPLGPLMDFGYENEVLFPMDIKVAKTVPLGPVEFHAKVDWLVCREVCIPGKADLDLRIEVAGPPPMGLATPTKDGLLWTQQVKPVPQADPKSLNATFQSTSTGFRLAVETGQRESSAEFFPADQNIVDNPAPQKLTPTAKGFVLDLKKDANLTANPAQLKGVLKLSGGRAYEIAAMPGTVAAGAPSLAWGLLARATGLAFLGGLLLNLMPCVFPVLFLKGLALVHTGHKELHNLRSHGFVYGAGIVVSFWVLVGALLGLRAAGATLGWGFQFQSPVFLALMAGLLFFLGLSLAGQFEIGLTLTSAGGSLAQKQGYSGSFFTGVLAVVVATPCTAPFMRGDRLCAGTVAGGDICGVYGAGAGAGCALCGVDAAAGVDAPAAQARRVDGSAAPGGFGADLCHGDLAGVVADQRLWGWSAGIAVVQPAATGRCRMVSGALAGKAMGNGGCGADRAGGDCGERGGAEEA
jgi:thiol:disulfide interchange protein DsbD